METKRKYKRVEFREPVEYYIEQGPRSDAGLGFDISESGLRFQSNQFIPIKAEVTLFFRVSRSEMVQVKGKVIWAQKVPHGETYHLGVEFDYDTSSDTQSRGQISQFIDRISPYDLKGKDQE